jgi:hypothetical protein
MTNDIVLLLLVSLGCCRCCPFSFFLRDKKQKKIMEFSIVPFACNLACNIAWNTLLVLGREIYNMCWSNVPCGRFHILKDVGDKVVYVNDLLQGIQNGLNPVEIKTMQTVEKKLNDLKKEIIRVKNLERTCLLLHKTRMSTQSLQSG